VTNPQIDITNATNDVPPAVMTLDEALTKYGKHIKSVAGSMTSQYRLSTSDREDMISAMRASLAKLPPVMWSQANYTKTCLNHAAGKVLRKIVAYESHVTPLSPNLPGNEDDDLPCGYDRATEPDSENTLIRKMALESALASLTPRQRQIISILFGLHGTPQTSDLRQIAARVGMGSRQEKQVQREIDAAMARMRRAAGATAKPTDNAGRVDG
jgi:DNA-directed RNA polymerase specialized sigma24 family protein